ncbi:MAG: HAD-IA family hydrolase [Chloroflexi bacterium]|nr:HAD-IA family hydrolase [Chloroflexota bacterium]
MDQQGRGMGAIRAVFFDVGGTLVYPHPSFPGVIARVLAQHGFPVPEEQIAALEPIVLAEMATLHAAGGGFTRSEAESRQFWHGLYCRFLDHLGIPAGGDLPRHLYDEFIKYETYRLYPDTLPALEALRARGVALGIISNWESWLEPLLLHLEIHGFFAATAISGHHGVEKPDPRIFELAVASLGVPPAEAAHVGDSVRHDVEGARRAGLVPVLIDRRGQRDGGDYLCISDLRQLPAVLGLDVPVSER